MKILAHINGLSREFLSQYYPNWAEGYGLSSDEMSYSVIDHVLQQPGVNNEVPTCNVIVNMEMFSHFADEIPHFDVTGDLPEFFVTKDIRIPVYKKRNESPYENPKTAAVFVELMKSLPDAEQEKLSQLVGIDFAKFTHSYDFKENHPDAFWAAYLEHLIRKSKILSYDMEIIHVPYDFKVRLFRDYTEEEYALMKLMGEGTPQFVLSKSAR